MSTIGMFEDPDTTASLLWDMSLNTPLAKRQRRYFIRVLNRRVSKRHIRCNRYYLENCPVFNRYINYISQASSKDLPMLRGTLDKLIVLFEKIDGAGVHSKPVLKPKETLEGRVGGRWTIY